MEENLAVINVNTVYDIENLYRENPDLAKKYLKNLLDGRFYFVRDQELSEGVSGVEDATHRVDSEHIPDPEDSRNMKKGTIKRWQMVLEEDPNAFMFKIGFTSAAQAQALLDLWSR
jgi:hypothetical protein